MLSLPSCSGAAWRTVPSYSFYRQGLRPYLRQIHKLEHIELLLASTVETDKGFKRRVLIHPRFTKY